MGALAERRRQYGVCRAVFDPLDASGGKEQPSSFSSPPWWSSGSSVDGCALLHSPWFLESRMHNERCMSGLEGGHRKPTAAMPHGAGARPYRSWRDRRNGPTSISTSFSTSSAAGSSAG